MSGLKHLIQCHCVLPQYRRMKDPVFHQFVVYSKFNKDNALKPKVSKCNNCGVFHNIVDFCKSEILHDYEGDGFLITIDDIEDQLPERISGVLKKNNCDLPTWENVLDVYQSREWGSSVVIVRNTIELDTHVKILNIIGKDEISIESQKIENISEIS